MLFQSMYSVGFSNIFTRKAKCHLFATLFVNLIFYHKQQLHEQILAVLFKLEVLNAKAATVVVRISTKSLLSVPLLISASISYL